MFKHGKTGKTYYSVREKINYYSSILNGKRKATPELKAKAAKRLPELQKINDQKYNRDNPKIVVTDDKKFGNGISKPRLCVAIKEDSKNRVMLAPILGRKTKTMILDEDTGRQISDKPVKWVDKSDIYERKYIDSKTELTKYDKEKLRTLFRE